MILLIIVVVLVITLISTPIIRHQRRFAHDIRQLAIYNNIVERTMNRALVGDVPRDEALIILNAARETYNESVHGKKRIQKTLFPEVHLDETTGASPRNEVDSEGQKPERKSRVGQHGRIWIVIRRSTSGHSGNVFLRSENETFSNGNGTWSHDERWIWILNDRDFDIVEVVKNG